MAKDQTQALAKVNEAQENLSVDNYKATAAEIMKDFSSVDNTLLQGLTQEYLQLKESTTYNMVFKNMTTFKGESGGEVPAVELVDEKGTTYINGNTVLVNSLSKVKQIPCLVRIVTGKKVKSGSGMYLDMDVFVLPKAANGE
jgi:hypothetical protein